jgi:uncharacterized protein
MMPATFQTYQAAFTAHLRQPAIHAKPAGVDSKRIRVYREIVFNNFVACVSTCFPVLLGILGKRHFGKLVRQCFFSQQFKSPLFQDIPGSFVDFLQSLNSPELPDYTAQLAHYEWIELVLSRQIETEAVALPAALIAEASALLHYEVRLPAVYRLLKYDFAVHQLSRKRRAITPEATYLLVYRAPDFRIRFIQLNAVTFQLLQQLQTHTKTSEGHLQDLAKNLPHLATESVIRFGLQTLYALYQQQALRTDGSVTTSNQQSF